MKRFGMLSPSAVLALAVSISAIGGNE